MRKKTMWVAVGIAVLLICCVVYFHPMSLSDIGGKTAALYVYRDDSLLHSIQITENGQLLLDSRIYKIKNAEQLLEQMFGILA